VTTDEDRFRGIVALQAWTVARNGQLPTDVATLAATTPKPARAELVIETLGDGDGPLTLRHGRVDLAGEDETERRRRVRAVARSAGLPEAVLPADLR
jgi:hypothetical protein